MQKQEKVKINYTFDLLLAHSIYLKMANDYTLGEMNEIITYNKQNMRKFWSDEELSNLCKQYVENPMKTINGFWKQIAIPADMFVPEEEVRKYTYTKADYQKVKAGLKRLDINYKPENLDLYMKAMTSNSLASNDFSNEKLEWLGDRVFNSIAVLFILRQFRIAGLSTSPIKSIIISGDAYLIYNQKIRWSDMVLTNEASLSDKQIVDAFEALYAVMLIDRGYSYALKWTAQNILPLVDRELILNLQTKRFVISFLDQKKLVKKKKVVTKLPDGKYHAHYTIKYKEKTFENEAINSEAVQAKNYAANPIFDELLKEEKLRKLMRKLYLFDNEQLQNNSRETR